MSHGKDLEQVYKTHVPCEEAIVHGRALANIGLQYTKTSVDFAQTLTVPFSITFRETYQANTEDIKRTYFGKLRIPDT